MKDISFSTKNSYELLLFCHFVSKIQRTSTKVKKRSREGQGKVTGRCVKDTTTGSLWERSGKVYGSSLMVLCKIQGRREGKEKL